MKSPSAELNVILPLLLTNAVLTCSPKKLRFRFIGTGPADSSSFPGRTLAERPGKVRNAPPPGKFVPVTCTVWVALLLVVVGSNSLATAVAVLSNVPVSAGTANGTRIRLTVLALVLPTASVPKLQWRVPLETAQSVRSSMLANTVFAGKMSVSVTPLAGLGPLFVTVIW